MRRRAHAIHFAHGVPQELDPAPPFPAAEGAGGAPSAQASPAWLDDWRLARTVQVNILLVAIDVEASKGLDEIRPDFCLPITAWRPGERLVLPPILQAGTLILEDISALALDDQACLLKWLDAAPACKQVVSTTSRSLLPLIEAGAFLDTLYYRLNVTCLDVSGSGRL